MAGSPLLGYNTNVRHLGKLYHIQTEDSGASHGHIFTHLFADGGRIIASKKTTYSQYIGTAEFAAVVKQLMRESHKAMFIALRDGLGLVEGRHTIQIKVDLGLGPWKPLLKQEVFEPGLPRLLLVLGEELRAVESMAA